ncbi:TonB-dependent receptor [candidate division KSB1 bacterium]|nr:TonB-dependent receptor [candidate division KSB1 bacterium]
MKIYKLPGSTIFIFIIIFSQAGLAADLVRDIKFISLDSLLNIPVSTASKYEQKTNEAPAAVTIITSDDIERYGYQTLDEIIMSIRSFYITNDRNYSYVGVRGFGRPTDYNNRILLLLNGHTLNDNVFTGALIGTELGLDINSIEHIEVVRGPGSVIYGTGAMLAVINIITKDGDYIDGMNFSAGIGSYGKKQTNFSFGRKIGNGFKFSISGLWGDIKGQDLYFKEYNYPDNNYGIAQNLDWDKFSGVMSKISFNNFTVQGMYTDREKGIPTGSWETNFNDPKTKSRDARKFIELKYSRNIGMDKYLMFRTYYDGYDFEETYPYDVMAFDKVNAHWTGQEIQFRWDLLTNFRLIAGMEYQDHQKADYTFWDENVTFFKGNFPYHLFSLYAQNEYQFKDNLSFTLGIRNDSNNLSGSSVSPRFGIIYTPSKDCTFKLLYGQAFRTPNIYEKYYQEEEYHKINPLLKPEKIKTSEFIFEKRLTKRIFGILSFYEYSMKDLIDWTIDPSDSLFLYKNLSKVRTQGIEMELNLRLDSGFRGYLNASYQDARNNSNDDRLTNSPIYIIKCGFTNSLAKFLNTGLEFIYEYERITVYRTKSEPYLLTNIHFSTPRLFNCLKLSLQVRNIFDKKYALPGGYEHYSDMITQNGRNFTFTSGIKF